MAATPLLQLLLLAAGVRTTCAAASNASVLLLIGDWGGSDASPYFQPGEASTAQAMAAYVESLPPGAAQAVVALGDNFYALGLCNNATLGPYNNTCPSASDPRAGTAADPRFNTTFEAVFNQPALAGIPWLVIAGNHDALGNVSASIAYTDSTSPTSTGRWQHPAFWYNRTFALATGATAELLLFDTTLCYGIWSDPLHTQLCNEQLAWLEASLASSTADYLFVAGHYPLWSACAHGNTEWALSALLPLLLTYNATGYLAGHDHCAEFIAPAAIDPAGSTDLVTLVTGTGDGCCYGEPNVGGVPEGSLKYLLSARYNQQNATGGFVALHAAQGDGFLTFRFYGAGLTSHGTSAPGPLYTSPPILPRVPLRDANGTVLAMLSPNYAAAGLVRPSQVSPAGNYSHSSMRMWRGSLGGHDESERLTLPLFDAEHDMTPAGGVVRSGAGAVPVVRELVIWLYAPTATNDTWSAWYSSLQAHAGNVTGVAPCLYGMDQNGAFTYQISNATALENARQWTQRMGSELGLSTLPLLAASGSGMNRVVLDGTGALQAAFINATVTEALALGLSGYNIQLEEPGNSSIQTAWTAFLNQWLDAFAPHNLTVSIIIGGVCRARDWMYMDCGNYKLIAQNSTHPRPNLRVISEATYEKEPSNWKHFLGDLLHGLSRELLSPGLEYGPTLDNPGNGCLPSAAAAGVTQLYVWVDTPSGDNVTQQAVWDAFGLWVNGGY